MATESIQPTRTPALSFLRGPTETPLVDLTLGELLEIQSERFGSRECLIIPWTETRWTYNDLYQQSFSLAKAISARGIRHGDRVGIMAGNCERYAALFFACMHIGAILVVLNNTYTAAEAQSAIDYTECKLLFTTPSIGKHQNKDLLSGLQEQPGTLQDIIILRGDSEPFTSYDKIMSEAECLPPQQVHTASRRLNAHDVCNLQFTSGTTGQPKAAMLTHL